MAPGIEQLLIDTPAGPVPARLEGDGSVAILLAPGAGTDQFHPGVAGLRSRLAALGHRVMTFDYAYRVAGRRFPDRPSRLLEVHHAVLDDLRDRGGRFVVLAGRSMGGRMGTMLAAAGEPCAAVICYGYPLHPAGKPDQLRVDHLGDVTVPMLMVTGTADALALPHLVEEHLAPLPTVTLDLVEGANHSFRLKGSTPSAMLDRLAGTTHRWLTATLRLGAQSRAAP